MRENSLKIRENSLKIRQDEYHMFYVLVPKCLEMREKANEK
jgi:hypothetical protein